MCRAWSNITCFIVFKNWLRIWGTFNISHFLSLLLIVSHIVLNWPRPGTCVLQFSLQQSVPKKVTDLFDIVVFCFNFFLKSLHVLTALNDAKNRSRRETFETHLVWKKTIKVDIWILFPYNLRISNKVSHIKFSSNICGPKFHDLGRQPQLKLKGCFSCRFSQLGNGILQYCGLRCWILCIEAIFL